MRIVDGIGLAVETPETLLTLVKLLGSGLNHTVLRVQIPIPYSTPSGPQFKSPLTLAGSGPSADGESSKAT